VKLNLILTLFSLCLISVSFSQKRKDLKTVKIDGIKITKQNLDQTSFRNGHKIKLALSLEEWKKYSEDKIPAYCYYDFLEYDEFNIGCFYNWYAVHDKRVLAPKGFHIPCIEEMNHLLEFLSPDNCGMEIKSISESTELEWDEIWDYELPNEMGFNSTGLSISPNDLSNGMFALNPEQKANFWIFNPENTQSWHVRDCKVNKEKDDKGYAAFRIDQNQSKSSMFSIRLIKN
jgi:uncharacterized protein (TIGR02145 family)